MALPKVLDLFKTVETLIFAPAVAVPGGTPFGKLAEFVAEAIRQVETLVGPGNGATKKELVLQACELFYDRYIAPLDIPFVPNLLVEPFVDAKLRTLVRPLCGPLVDVLVSAFDGPVLSKAASHTKASAGMAVAVMGKDANGRLVTVDLEDCA